MYDFRELAACRDVDPELFFPAAEPGSVAYPAQVAQAKAVCAVCPVRAECAEYAGRVGADHGIFGGLTPDERRTIRVRRAA